MADQDYDSADSEADDFTETNVLLGFTSKENRDDEINHLGGRPLWIDHNYPPSAIFATCKICNSLMALLLQLNGTLPDYFPGHVRRLYLWICKKPSCKRKNGSVRALRGVQLLKTDTEAHELKLLKNNSKLAENSDVNLGEVIFASAPLSCAKTNPFSSEAKAPNPFTTSISKPSNNPFSAVEDNSPLSQKTKSIPCEEVSHTDLSKSFADTLRLNEQNVPKTVPVPHLDVWPQDPELLPTFPLLYLVDTEFETLEVEEEKHQPPVHTMDWDDGKSQGNYKEDKVIFESSIDQTFQKFADRIGQNPEQVIRYEFRGQPLLYSKDDQVGKIFSNEMKYNQKVTCSSGSLSSNSIPRCENCGAKRVFELQLTPYAISDLERGENSIEDGMEWGTIIVAVCEDDCWPQGVSNTGVGYLEEWIGVQWE